MSVNSPQHELMTNENETQPPRVVPVAAAVGLVMAIVLLLLQLPLLVIAGLWLLGQALVLISYAFFVLRRYKTEAWEIAIAGQIAGLLGIALLFIASLLGV